MKLTICSKYKMPEDNQEPKRMSAAYYLKLMKVGQSVTCTKKESTRFYPAQVSVRCRIRVKYLSGDKARVWKVKEGSKAIVKKSLVSKVEG